MAKLIDAIISRASLEEIKNLCLVENQNVNYFNGTTTPIHSATDYFEDEIVDLIKFLVEEEAKVNVNDIEDTPLLKCVRNGSRLQVIDELLKLGANPNIKDSQGRNALHLSVLYHPDDEQQTLTLVHLLLHSGVDYEAKKYDGCTPLMDFIRFGKYFNIVRSILIFGADPNASDLHSNTALHFCCNWNWLFSDNMDCFNLEVLKDLLLHGADLFSKNCHQETPLDNFFTSSKLSGNSSEYVEPMMYEILKCMTIGMYKTNKTKHNLQNVNGKINEKRSNIEEEFPELFCLTGKYVQELTELRLYTLFKDTSLYTLCSTTNRMKLGSIYRRVSSIHNMQKLEDDIRIFKSYSGLLETRLQIGKDWSLILKDMEHLKLTLSATNGAGEVELNFDCMQHIYSFLNKFGIMNLIIASK